MKEPDKAKTDDNHHFEENPVIICFCSLRIFGTIRLEDEISIVSHILLCPGDTGVQVLQGVDGWVCG